MELIPNNFYEQDKILIKIEKGLILVHTESIPNIKSVSNMQHASDWTSK